MKLLVIGSGGREHALAWKLLQSPRVQHVFVAPGNGGTALMAHASNVALSDPAALADFVQREGVSLTVVGPEAPLAAGVVDTFRARGLSIFGPTRAAAQLESSKDYAKAFMVRHHIPTAAYQTFTDPLAAHVYIDERGAPIVIKADGLAAGKGVVVAMTLDEAHAAVDAMLGDGALGTAGARVVIEDCLLGEEASFIVLCDGQHTIRGMDADGIPFTGFLYAGLMIGPGDDASRSIKVLEFNCRMGDPESQPIMMRIRSDLLDVFEHGVAGSLDRARIDWDPRTALGVVLASANYPGTPRLGDAISGIPDAEPDCVTFHAGTTISDGTLVTSGGRVLCVTALDDSVAATRQRVYTVVDAIRFNGAQFRRDIGWRALEAR